MALFKDSTSIYDAQIEELFSKKKESEMDIIMKTLTLIIYQNSNNTDLVEIFKLFGVDGFSQLIMLLDGRPIKLPSANEFKEKLILSLIYYYREVKNLPWNEVKEKFPFEISGISYGIQVKQLNSWLKQKMNEYFKNMDNGENTDEEV